MRILDLKHFSNTTNKEQLISAVSDIIYTKDLAVYTFGTVSNTSNNERNILNPTLAAGNSEKASVDKLLQIVIHQQNLIYPELYVPRYINDNQSCKKLL